EGITIDTMLASYLLDATSGSHTLEALAIERVGYRATTGEEVQGRGVKAVALDTVPPAAVLTLAADRAELPLRLADPLSAALVEQALSPVYEDIERPLLPILADIEQHGVKIDTAALG